MSAKLTIAIPTFNNPQQLGWCLNSLISYTEYPYQIWVVDNGNSLGIRESLEALLFKNLRVFSPERNLGWMGGINLALAECETEYFTMLNDDVVFSQGDPLFWRKLAGLLDSDPEIGFVGPSSNYIAGMQSIYAFCDTHSIIETSLLINVCTMVRTAEFKQLGGLDESLPGGDDLDLSIRYRKNKQKLVVNKNAFLHHIGRQSGPRVFGDFYDSADMQEQVNHALIAKHGVRAWFETQSARWVPYQNKANLRTGKSEKAWYSDLLERFKQTPARGLNLGAGDVRFEGLNCRNVDLRRSGETGVGGMKGRAADTDIVSEVSLLPMVESDSQDFLIAAHILEHVIDPLRALREWYRVAKPGGRLFLSVPNHERVPSMVIDSSHLHAFNQESLKGLLRAADWDVFEVEPDHGISLRAIARKVG